MPMEMSWCSAWSSLVATAMTIQNQAPQQLWIFLEYGLDQAVTTIRDNSGNLDPISIFVQLRTATAAFAL